MSIPLIQEATKDAINTSIIAIKRNIERINMLLGLSNSEEIDTSKFATKDELQQAVTDLQPVDEVAIDNMQSVSSNAVAKSLSYSTTEQKTGGYWIDGKPIYRKLLINSDNITGASPVWGGLQNSITSLNIDKCTASYAVCTNGLRYLQFFPDSGFVSYYSGVINGSYIVLEYTKTTD